MIESNSEPIIGIDLGTTYSCVAVVLNGEVKVIENGLGNKKTPSYISFEDNETIIGDPAKERAGINPENTFFDIKRLIGRRYSDKHIQDDTKLWPFIVLNVDNKPRLKAEIDNKIKRFHPEELSAMVLGYLKQVAEEYLQEKVKKAVITVPAYFNDSQRHATRHAGEIAGIEVIGLLSEPTAAAIAYGFNKRNKEEKILVFDLGGGTLDVSVLVVKKGKIDVKGISGDTHLGGEDFDNRLVTYCVEEFEKFHTKCNLLGNPRALRRLRTQCEKAKITLSAANTHRIVLEGIIDGEDLEITVTRKRFEVMCSDLFNSLMKPVEEALEMSNFSKHQIDEVILIGGSTKIPKVRELLSSYFDGKKLNMSSNPDETVACGAAIRAQNGYKTNFVINEITSLTLGVGLRGDTISVMLPRGSKIPSVFSADGFCTAYDDQVAGSFPIYEGERKVASENYLLGEIVFTGIEPRPRGEIDFNVTFQIDSDGILEVTAFQKEKRETKKLSVRLDKNRLTREEIEELVKQSEFMRKRDEKELQRIKSREDLIDNISSIKKQGGLKYSKVADELNKLSEWISKNSTASKDAFDEQNTKLTKFYEFAIKEDSKLEYRFHDSSSSSNDPERECMICFENQKNTVFDCGHVLMCYNCAQNHIKNERMKRCPLCPVCSQEITEVKKIYY